MKLKNLTPLIVICSFLISGCYSKKPFVSKQLFNDICFFQKPKEAKTSDDILKNYIELFNAYENNLLLLQTIEKMQN